MTDDPIKTTQSVGDLIGRAIRVYRINVVEWAKILIWPTVAVTLGRGMISAGAAGISKDMNVQGIGMLILMLLGLGILLIARWLLIVRALAFVRLSTGFAQNLTEALVYTKKRMWSILGVMILTSSVCMAVVTLWLLEVVASIFLYNVIAIPAIIGIVAGVIGMIASIIFVYIAMYIALCAMACEEGSITSLISKAFAMCSKVVFRTLGAGFMIWLTVFIVAMPLWLPIWLLLGLDMVRLGPDAFTGNNVPFHWNLLLSVWESLLDMICAPVMYLCYGFFYYDLRLRSEGVDLVQNLDALKLQKDAAR